MAQQITAADAKAMIRPMFDAIDENKNGSLDKAECHKVAEAMQGQFKPGQEFDEAKFEAGWEKFDKNGDGKVEFEEMMSTILEGMKNQGMLKEE